MSDEQQRGALVWPIGIILALLVVVAVNATMIWIAVSDADTVVASYNVGKR